VKIALSRSTALIGAGTQITALWLFVLSFVTLGVGRDHADILWIGMAVLASAAFVLSRPCASRRAINRIVLTAATLTLVLGAYLTFGSWPSSFGSARSYDTQAIYFVITYVTVSTFAVLFFEERSFERVVWQAATLELWAGVLCCLASRLTHRLILVSVSHGALRMKGTLTEPSAWAPVITVVVLLAIRRRSWLYVALAAIGLVLLASPICILVLVAAVPLYYALTGTRRHRIGLLLTLAALIPAAVFLAHTASPRHYLNSHNTAELTVGRLLAGIESVQTDGQAGHNTRFASTRAVLAQARINGWILAGAGPAADSTYFPEKFPTRPHEEPLLPDALWVSVFFDFGLGGVSVLVILMSIAIWRMRHNPGMSAIMIPFFVTALINSAEGSFEYAFVALGVMLYAFGWEAKGDVPSVAQALGGRPGVTDIGRDMA
jgi:hypothetical protein